MERKVVIAVSLIVFLVCVGMFINMNFSHSSNTDYDNSEVMKKIDSLIMYSNQTYVETNPENNILIRGLGVHNPEDLEKISKYVKDFFGYNCKVVKAIPTTSKMYSYDNNSTLEVSQCISEIGPTETKTIYVTNEDIISEGLNLRGGTYLNSNIIIIEHTKSDKKTVIHELGHTLGLDHCDNLNCLMSIHNDDYEVKDFCNNCKKKLKK